MRYIGNQLLLIVLLLLLYSCSSTRKVPDGYYLLKKNTVKLAGSSDDKRYLSTDEISAYIRQRPNRNDMFKFYLGLYNMSGKDTTKWVNRKLTTWGEAPVIFDSTQIQYSVSNIGAYMRNRGYYHAEIKDSIIYKKKKAEVQYTIIPNNFYRIRGLEYDIADTVIKNIVLSDTMRRRTSPSILSANILDWQRDRITTNLRNKGYYTFNKSFISFEADSTVGNMEVDLKMIIPKYAKPDSNNQTVKMDYPVYYINDVYVYTNYNSLQAATDSGYIKSFDTLYNNGIYILYKDNMNLKPGVLSRVNLFERGDLYSEEKVNMTYNNLSDLLLFKSITIQFREASDSLLDCVILLDPFSSQSYKVDFEISTNSSDLIGFSPGLSYAHRNFFGGAEIFNLDFRGVFQYSFGSTKQSSQEYNASTTLRIPRFLMPISLGYFKTKLPHTQLSTAFVYQQRPDYTRAMGNFRFGYIWNSSQTNTYLLNLLDFSMIRMLELSDDFKQRVDSTTFNPYLRSSYSNHFILGITGSYIYNTQRETSMLNSRRRRESYFYARINGDIAGNLLSLFNFAMPTDSLNSRLIGGMPYSQYAKADVNMVYNVPIRNSAIVYRFYFGIGKAYGNIKSLPFEKMFYSGGANSLRGWQIRSIGPGSVSADSIGVFPNQVGDLKLELNVEYRFPLFWKFEGAVFADAGNIWSLASTDENAKFKFNKFYNEIALDTGLGLRLNFDYFVLRFDLGCKVHNPGLSGNKFVNPSRWFKNGNFNLHFGINYPF